MSHYEKKVFVVTDRKLFAYSDIDLYLYLKETGKPSLYGEITWKPLVEGQYPEISARLCTEAAQRLMDNLWNCGIRPTEAAGSAGQLAAVQAHLEDMRKIAFSGLDIENTQQ